MWRISFLLLLVGCGAPYKVTVYGGTGKQYIAPDLCAAVIQCKIAQPVETECYYNASVMTYADGHIATEACKEAK